MTRRRFTAGPGQHQAHLRDQPLAGPVTITRADGTTEVRPAQQPTISSSRLTADGRHALRADVHDATCPGCGALFPPATTCQECP